MAATNTQIPTLDGAGTIPAYVARPDADSTRAIIVIPEIFGVNEGIRKKCDDWAAEGYLAIAPDIFWRFAPGVELSPDIEAEFQQALDYFGQYDADDGVKDIEAAIHWLRSQGAKPGHGGVVAAAEIAAAQLPHDVAAMLAVIGTEPALAGVMVKVAHFGAQVERLDRIGAERAETHRGDVEQRALIGL